MTYDARSTIEQSVNDYLSSYVSPSLAAKCAEVVDNYYFVNLANAWTLSTKISQERLNGHHNIGVSFSTIRGAEQSAKERAHTISSTFTPWRNNLYQIVTKSKTEALYSTSIRLGEDNDQYSFVDECHTCNGNTKVRCFGCHGDGMTNCLACRGQGHTSCGVCSGSGTTFTQAKYEYCQSCNGRGELAGNNCYNCYGKGKVDIPSKQETCSSCSGRGKKNCMSCNNGTVVCSTCSGKGELACRECGATGRHTYLIKLEVFASGSPSLEIDHSKCTVPTTKTVENILLGASPRIPLRSSLNVPAETFNDTGSTSYPLICSAYGELLEFKAELLSNDGRQTTGFFYGLNASPLTLGNIGENYACNLLEKSNKAIGSANELDECLTDSLFQRILTYRKNIPDVGKDALVKLGIISPKTLEDLLASYWSNIDFYKHQKDFVSNKTWLAKTSLYLTMLFGYVFVLGAVKPEIYLTGNFGISALEFYISILDYKLSNLFESSDLLISNALAGAVVYLFIFRFLAVPKKETTGRRFFAISLCFLFGDALLVFFGFQSTLELLLGGEYSTYLQQEVVSGPLSYSLDLIAAAFVISYFRCYRLASTKLKKSLMDMSTSEVREDLGY